MPFGTISSQSVDYVPRSPGIYQKSSITFGSPTDEFRIRPALGVSKDGYRRASITKVLEKDLTLNGVVVRKASVVTLSIMVPDSGFTAAEIDSQTLDVSNFVTADTISRVLQGEQ